MTHPRPIVAPPFCFLSEPYAPKGFWIRVCVALAACPACGAARLEPCRKTRVTNEAQWARGYKPVFAAIEPLQWRRGVHHARKEVAPRRGDVVALLTRATIAKKSDRPG